MSEQDTRNTRKIINEIRASFGAPPTTITDEQIEAGREVYGAKLDYDMAVIDEVQDTREKLNEELMDSCLTFADHGGHLRAYSFVSKLLDRQVAITEREQTDKWQHLAYGNGLLEADKMALQDSVAELTAERDALREQREHWFNEAVEIYRRFYPHDEYGTPQNIAEMVLAKVDELQAANKPNSQSDVLKTAETAENATSKDEIHDFDDSREKLEADIEKLCTGILAHRVEYQKEYCKLHGLQPDKNHSCWSETQWLYPVMMHLLDRQSAITERETRAIRCFACNWADERAELTADAKRWADAANEQRLVAMEQANKVRALTAERDELEAFSKRIETAAHDKLGVTLFGVDYVTEEFMLHVRDTLTAEVEKQKQRANDAERGVLSDEWYVARDRYEDDVAALTAERDKWRARAEQVQESYLDAKDSRDKAQIKNACLREAIEDFMQKKQPYAFDADDPLGSLRTIWRYVDELTIERDKLQDALNRVRVIAMNEEG